MAYTEIKERNSKKYYYRVMSVRKGKKVSKRRIYLGLNLKKSVLSKKESEADIELKRKTNFEKIIPEIKKILVKKGVRKAGIFGSFSTGKQNKESDIDILIVPPKGIGFGLASIESEIEKRVKRKVDLVSYNGLSPYLKESILNEEVRIL